MSVLTSPSSIRDVVGRRTPAEIRTYVLEHADADPADLAWLATVADRLALSGFLTLNDVTDDEFDDIVARAA